MSSDEISGEGYTVKLDRAAHAVAFTGSLRLMDSNEYAPIAALLEESLRSTEEPLTLDLRTLLFLNSAGIQMLLRFGAKLRDASRPCTLRGSTRVPWHNKLLRNLQHLIPALRLELE